MFEVNNEEEYPLLKEDFPAVEAAAKELTATGKVSPRTRATLEKVLPLEHFQLVQQDSVMYYAFAEDNRPGQTQRTESDLRFIDIRPFRRLYRVQDRQPGENPEDGGPPLKSLEELIARQRYALNRAIQLDRQYKRSNQADLVATDALTKFERDLARFTRDLAKGLERLGINETEMLYEAERSMLLAVDSLDQQGNYEVASLQMRDALKSLIEGRNRLQVIIAKNPNRRQLAQLRSFDRTQQQKLRRPKSDEEEAREVVERLKDLADQEDFVYKTLSGTPEPGSGEDESQSEGSSEKESPKKSKEGATGEDSGAKEKGKEPAKGKKEPAKKEGGSEEPKTEPGKKAGPGDKDEGAKEPGKGRGKMPSRKELVNRQLDVGAESREVEKALAKLQGITDLAKERMAASAKAAEDAGSALERGATGEAKEGAKTAGGGFRELAAQVQALIAQQQAERIAAAQRMATELAREQQDFVDRLANKTEGGGAGEPKKKPKEDGAGKGKKEAAKKEAGTEGGKKEQDMPGLGSDAERIAEKAKTLADVLGAAAKAEDPDDQASAKKVQELIGALKLPDLTERLQDLPGQVRSGKLEDAKATAGDGSERMEAAAEQLAALHRAIVAPKLDELAKAEQQLANLDEELDRLDAPARITDWHVDASKLLDELDKLGISKELIDKLLDEMKKGGWGPDVRNSGWTWARNDGGYYAAPAGYRVLLSRLLNTVQSRMQELQLTDLASSRDEPIPPKYREAVDKFQQVLSSEGKERTKRMVPPQK
jgi:hypothetical protein